MFELKRDNVHRIVETEVAKNRLINEGFKEVEVSDDDKPLDEMTVPELKKFATKNEIDLGDAKTKPEVLAKIEAHNAGGGNGSQ
jgi:hypothetical protein